MRDRLLIASPAQKHLLAVDHGGEINEAEVEIGIFIRTTDALKFLEELVQRRNQLPDLGIVGRRGTEFPGQLPQPASGRLDIGDNALHQRQRFIMRSWLHVQYRYTYMYGIYLT